MTKVNTSLSIPQLLVLTTAAARVDHMIMPLPTTLKARGASQQRLLASLLKLALVEEVITDALNLSWRRDKAGQQLALKITVAGLIAVGADALDTASEQQETDSMPEPVSLGSPSNTDCQPDDTTSAPPTKAGPAGKLGQVLAAVGAEQGATVEELVILTGWQKHTTRAALTRLRQRGYPLQLIKQADRKAYCLTLQAGA